MRVVKSLVAAALVAVVVSACKPNEGAQMQQWQNNVSSVEAYGRTYPTARKVLDSRLAEAKAAWDAAGAESDKEKRAVLMKDVNTMITDATRGLNSLDGRVQTIKRLKADSRLRKKPHGQVAAVIHEVDVALAKANQIVNSGKIGTVEELQARTKAANGALIHGMAPLERLVKQK